MARINLLPWREGLRRERQRNFMAALIGVAVIAALLVFLAAYTVGSQIDTQNSRNDYLRAEIKKLDVDIAAIKRLEQTRDDLLARKNVIEQLQENRSMMVHLFNTLASTVPEGVRLLAIGQSGNILTIKGASQSETRVSDYMRSIEAAEWLHDPALRILQAAAGAQGSLEPFNFELRARLASPRVVEQENDGFAFGGEG